MEEPFIYEAKEQTLIIHLPKELDHHNCRNLKYETDLLLAENYITRLVFDFSDTCFMDSSGIGMIMGRYKALGLRGGSILAVHVNDRMKRLLKLSGVYRFITVSRENEPANH